MKNYYRILLLSVLSVFLLALIPYSGGSPGAKSGSPADGGNCTACHAGTATEVSGWIASTVDAAGYIPGETYTITATGTHSGVGIFGFELTAENASDMKRGIFTISNDSETKLCNSDAAVTHTSGGTTADGDTKSWSVDWTAPAAGSGDITFYAAFNAANNNRASSGDVIYTSALTVSEKSSTEVILGDSESEALTIFQATDPNKLVVGFNSDIDNKISLRIYDHVGRLVLSEDRRFVNKEIIVDVSHLESSVYIIQIESLDDVFSRKVRVRK